MLRRLQWQALRCPGPLPAELQGDGAQHAEVQPGDGGLDSSSSSSSGDGSSGSANSSGEPSSSSSEPASSGSASVSGVSGWNGAAVSWHRSLDEVALQGPALYIAHEFLDALPVHQFQRTGGPAVHCITGVSLGLRWGWGWLEGLPRHTAANHHTPLPYCRARLVRAAGGCGLSRLPPTPAHGAVAGAHARGARAAAAPPAPAAAGAAGGAGCPGGLPAGGACWRVVLLGLLVEQLCAGAQLQQPLGPACLLAAPERSPASRVPQSMALAESLGRRVAQHGGAALIIDYGQVGRGLPGRLIGSPDALPVQPRSDAHSLLPAAPLPATPPHSSQPPALPPRFFPPSPTAPAAGRPLPRLAAGHPAARLCGPAGGAGGGRPEQPGGLLGAAVRVGPGIGVAVPGRCALHFPACRLDTGGSIHTPAAACTDLPP